MTKQSVQQFSSTASLNTDIAGINVNTGWSPANVGPAFRELMALLASSLQPLVLSIAGQTAVTLTAAQASAQAILFTGALTADCTITYPDAVFVGTARNLTTGGHNVLISAGAGTDVTVPPGPAGWFPFECDGVTNVASVVFATAGGAVPVRGYLAGLALKNDSVSPNTVLDVAAGYCTDTGNSVAIQLASFTKSTGGSWAAGSGANGMGNGLTVQPGTIYHVFAIINANVADVYFDTSISAANAPPGTTAHRRIGSIETDGSGHILAFIQNGDTFLWGTEMSSQNTTIGTTPANYAVSVPSGVSVTALLKISISNPSAAFFYIWTPNITPNTLAADLGCTPTNDAAGDFQVLTTASSEIAAVASVAGTVMRIVTKGWIDRRGQDD